MGKRSTIKKSTFQNLFFKALIEIFLITSGVLIAVQVNNYNED